MENMTIRPRQQLAYQQVFFWVWLTLGRGRWDNPVKKQSSTVRNQLQRGSFVFEAWFVYSVRGVSGPCTQLCASASFLPLPLLSPKNILGNSHYLVSLLAINSQADNQIEQNYFLFTLDKLASANNRWPQYCRWGKAYARAQPQEAVLNPIVSNMQPRKELAWSNWHQWNVTNLGSSRA